jgi:hypothetical protein
MSWSDYKPPIVMIEAGGSMRPVRGLALEDLTQLVTSHLPDMIELTALYVEHLESVLDDRPRARLISHAVMTFPKLVSEVISMVTDEPALRDVKMPFGISLSVLDAAVRLTVEDAGGLGNLFATLRDQLQVVMAANPEVSQKAQQAISNIFTSDAGATPTSSSPKATKRRRATR